MAIQNKDAFRKIKVTLKNRRDKFFNKSNLKKYGDDLAEDVRIRVRQGFGVKEDLKAKRELKKLSPKYVDYRKSLKSGKTPTGRKSKSKLLGKLSTLTNPSKSNLTLTGQMTGAFKGQSKKNTVGAFISKPRKSPCKGAPNNQEIAGYNEDMGRTFFYITNKEYKRLTNEIRKDLQKYLLRSI